MSFMQFLGNCDKYVQKTDFINVKLLFFIEIADTILFHFSVFLCGI